MPAMLVHVVAAVSTVAFRPFAAPARSSASTPSPIAAVADSTAVSVAAPASALVAAPPLRHAQAAALLAQLRGDVHEQRRLVREMKGLAITAMDGTLLPHERVLLDVRFQRDLFQLQQLALASHWNGIPLLSTVNSSVALQVHPARAVLYTLWLVDLTALSLGLAREDIVTAANAADAYAACDTALDHIDTVLEIVRAAALALGL